MKKSDGENVVVFWFRRDLRHKDNHGLLKALQSGQKVLPIFIFDPNILDQLKNPRDLRVQFIFRALNELEKHIPVQIHFGRPKEVFGKLCEEFSVKSVYANEDYEPEALRRDQEVSGFLAKKGIEFKSFKDQVIFSPSEVLKSDGTPYLVFTPFSRTWKEKLKTTKIQTHPSESHLDSFLRLKPTAIKSLEDIGFEQTPFDYPGTSVFKSLLKSYGEQRNFPANEKGTTHLGLHLRFGTVSVRHLVSVAKENSEVWLNELIWREFFMMILFHFPKTVSEPFKEKYSQVPWREDSQELKVWEDGLTGYPIVDAGMRELKATGFMHNRVRMITASFLTKHLLIHWKLGERHFAKLLLDFELSSNIGNWQWVAGCGVDAAPYFRIFNPESQQKKFDPKMIYVKKWVPEFGTPKYPEPMVDHEFARRRALSAFKDNLKETK